MILVVILFTVLYSFGILVGSERVVGHHIVAEPLESVLGRETPVGGTSGENLNDGEALLVKLILERLFDHLFRVHYVLGGVYGNSRSKSNAVEGREHFANADGATLDLAGSAVGGCGRNLAGQGCRCHLTACHTVDTVVDEDNCDVMKLN